MQDKPSSREDPDLPAQSRPSSLIIFNQQWIWKMGCLTLVMLNKLRCHSHFQFSANQMLDPGSWYKFIYMYWMTNSADQDQKPTDLDLHCLQRQCISGLSIRRVNQTVWMCRLIWYPLEVSCWGCSYKFHNICFHAEMRNYSFWYSP